jgi:hypothetical protein
MKLARNEKAGMDFEFQRKFMEISSEYREVMDEDPRDLCRASWETARYINEKLPEGMGWDNEEGLLYDYCDEKYSTCSKVDFHGEIYAVCPEAYEQLDALIPDAVKFGLKSVFGHARKIRK